MRTLFALGLACGGLVLGWPEMARTWNAAFPPRPEPPPRAPTPEERIRQLDDLAEQLDRRSASIAQTLLREQHELEKLCRPYADNLVSLDDLAALKSRIRVEEIQATQAKTRTARALVAKERASALLQLEQNRTQRLR